MVLTNDNNISTDSLTGELSGLDKIIQNLLLVLIPFYPVWAWLCVILIHKQVEFVTTIVLLPLVLYFIIYVNKRLPKYLLFYIGFTFYHLFSAFINNTVPSDANKIYFVLYDPNVLACLFFIIIEYTSFDERFIKKMTVLILSVVFLSFIISMVQVKIPTFWFNMNADEDLMFIGESRNYSIFSWTNLNTVGITFPIFISIMLAMYLKNRFLLPIIIICGIVVSFLSRTRYAMISVIIALSQIFLNGGTSLKKRLSYLLVLIGIFGLIMIVAHSVGFDINEVIDERILEKSSDMGSAKVRLLSYDVFMQVFPESPILGVGPETRDDVIYLLAGEAPVIHVGYLCYLYYYGIVGCFFIFMSFFFLLRTAWQVGRRSNFWGSFYGILSFCLANWTLVYFNLSEMGVVLAVIYLKFFLYRDSIDHSDLDDEEEALYFNRDLTPIQSSSAR